MAKNRGISKWESTLSKYNNTKPAKNMSKLRIVCISLAIFGSIYNHFFILNQKVSNPEMSTETTIIPIKEKLSCEKGSGTFIPKKLAIIVGIIKIIVTEVSRLTTIFKLLEITQQPKKL